MWWLPWIKTPIVSIPSPFNGLGRAPDKITWEEASTKYRIFSVQFLKTVTLYYVAPKKCHVCQKVLSRKFYDYQKIEESGQYMVQAYECDNGCGHFIEWA